VKVSCDREQEHVSLEVKQNSLDLNKQWSILCLCIISMYF